jgi:hypothetical protein
MKKLIFIILIISSLKCGNPCIYKYEIEIVFKDNIRDTLITKDYHTFELKSNGGLLGYYCLGSSGMTKGEYIATDVKYYKILKKE